jgi:hypothetical protein
MQCSEIVNYSEEWLVSANCGDFMCCPKCGQYCEVFVLWSFVKCSEVVSKRNSVFFKKKIHNHASLFWGVVYDTENKSGYTCDYNCFTLEFRTRMQQESSGIAVNTVKWFDLSSSIRALTIMYVATMSQSSKLTDTQRWHGPAMTAYCSLDPINEKSESYLSSVGGGGHGVIKCCHQWLTVSTGQ